ncbi:hypothetical protein ACFV0T_36135 [Streptomyces sp. NPDC059582]|uniref:hypothetical protein n=1 Tax=Streptomyces sp. NPDC059582 TaxID=3346875 RepID=UPI0036A40340
MKAGRGQYPEPETGDAGAAAFLHGPGGLFPTDIPTQTLGGLREDQGPTTLMDTALRESLTVLRLSGMLETLDARLAQAHGGELGHLDFPPGPVSGRNHPP